MRHTNDNNAVIVGKRNRPNVVYLQKLTGLARKEVGLVIGLLLTGGLLLGFGSLAAEVLEGKTAAFDRTILLLFRHANDLSAPIGPPP